MSRNDSENILSFSGFVSFLLDNFVLIIIMIAFFLGGFYFGSLWTENKMLKNGGVGAGAQLPSVVADGTAPSEAVAGKDLSIPSLVAEAVALGLDEDEVQNCIDSDEMADKVASDFAGGSTGGVTGTPGTIVMVDGQPAELIGGALPYAQVSPIIEKYLNGDEIDPTLSADVANAPAVTSEDHYVGSPDARVVLVTYTDYECPYCEAWHPTFTQLLADYPEIAGVYRNYPLSFHPYAQKSAEAAECVAKLGGNDDFWKYTESLFM